ncbi:endonuclease/exonuclease/phosphatase family protein [Oryzifoliimicrobium ureilyticus]|uniref:endonuclease/exonuclease/phosphatase family protein n=1 Tax=Oryzifoliimicrobium ureilyticus TaxID=3113724 RepID=UPI0030763360
MRDTLFCIISVLVSLLLAAISLRYGTSFWLFAFIYSFQVHFAIAAACGAILALMIKRHWYGYVMLAAAIGLAVHGVIMLKEFATPPSQAPQLFSMISFNIENENYENADKITQIIRKSGADVVNVFEAEPIFADLPQIKATYPYSIGCQSTAESCDTLVLSKHPFLEQKIMSIGELWQNRMIHSAIEFAGKRVDFLAVHLTKPYFDDFQLDELKDISYEIGTIKEPLVVAGDFNSSVLTPGIQRFMRREQLKTVFPEPATWPIRAGPFGIAIDHIFARNPLQLIKVSRIKDNAGSNHYGLEASFSLAP